MPQTNIICAMTTLPVMALPPLSKPVRTEAQITFFDRRLTSSKLRAKQRAKKERKQEYEENFNVLQEQNAHRVRQLSNQGSLDGRTLYGDGVTDHGPEMHETSRTGSTAHITAPAPALPKYDDIVEGTASRHPG
ncbi:hypothetical protein E4T39_08752 [Aureobasidium subglaciale]|nr:hypothetical protein E4T39_08752 [Aureobasidium subglaciale]